MDLIYRTNMGCAWRIISELCGMPYGLATKDLKMRARRICDDAGNESITDDNSEHVALLIKGSKILQITCFLML